MLDSRPFRSILAVDIGTTLTHAGLIEPVEGVYRLIARAETLTTRRPQVDLMDSLKQGIRSLEETVQRPLLDSDGTPLSSRGEQGGINTLVITSSAAPPVDCALIGLTGDLSLQSGAAAVRSAHGVVSHQLSLIGERHRQHEAFAQLRQTPPDALIMLGGVDGGPTHPLENAADVLATLFADIEPDSRPIVICAGNQEARRPIAQALGSSFDYRVVENIRPSLDKTSPQELQRELLQIYTHQKLPRLSGYDQLAEWADTPIMASSTGLGIILRFLSRQGHFGQRVLGIDVGGASTYIGMVDERQFRFNHIAHMGMAQGMEGLIAAVDASCIQQWLPLGEHAVTHLRNQALRPQGLPEQKEEILVLQAAARETIRLALDSLQGKIVSGTSRGNGPAEFRADQSDLLAARGGILAHPRDRGLALLALLDAVQPEGFTRVVLDWASLWPQLGALAQLDSLAALQVLEQDALLDLGTVVSVCGQCKEGQMALRVRLTADGKESTEAVIPYGHVQRLALAEGEVATLEAWPSRHVQIDTGKMGQPIRSVVHGGHLGVIVDTRGRPLELAQEPAARAQEISKWQQDLF